MSIFTPVGHVLANVNGMEVTGCTLGDGRNAMEVIEDPANYPLSLKFVKPKLTTNEKIFQVNYIPNIFV